MIDVEARAAVYLLAKNTLYICSHNTVETGLAWKKRGVAKEVAMKQRNVSAKALD